MATLNTNVDFSESRAAEIHIIGWVFTGIAIVTVLLKLFSRVKVVKKAGWDDFFIFFSLVSERRTPIAERLLMNFPRLSA